MISSLVISAMDIAASLRPDPPPPSSESPDASDESSSDESSQEESESLPPPPAFTRSVFTAYVCPVALCVALRTTANPPVPMASPMSYSSAKGRWRWTYPMERMCAALSSSCNPPGADLERRSDRTFRSDASDLNAVVSSPETRAGAG